MAHVITFTNHAPIKIADADLIETVWNAEKDFGHHLLRRYTTKRGKALYWVSYNNGMHYGTQEPETRRTYLPNAAAIREYFEQSEKLDIYHSEIEAEVDAGAIIDVDAIA